MAPVEQAPAHAPAVHVYGQAAPLCHVPVRLHVCGVTPSLAHWVEPGVHVPVQAPPLQT
jgi:hypothetical protein